MPALLIWQWVVVLVVVDLVKFSSSFLWGVSSVSKFVFPYTFHGIFINFFYLISFCSAYPLCFDLVCFSVCFSVYSFVRFIRFICFIMISFVTGINYMSCLLICVCCNLRLFICYRDPREKTNGVMWVVANFHSFCFFVTSILPPSFVFFNICYLLS